MTTITFYRDITRSIICTIDRTNGKEPPKEAKFINIKLNKKSITLNGVNLKEARIKVRKGKSSVLLTPEMIKELTLDGVWNLIKTAE